MSSEIGHAAGSVGAGKAWRAMYDLVASREAHARLVQAADKLAVAPGVIKALMQLGGDEPVAMRNLAEFFRCDASYVTNLVDGLEEAGLAGRQPHPGDRRVKVVELTPRGVEALATVRAIMDEPPAWLDAISDTDLKQLERILTKLTEAAAVTAAGDTEARATG